MMCSYALDYRFLQAIAREKLGTMDQIEIIQLPFHMHLIIYIYHVRESS